MSVLPRLFLLVVALALTFPAMAGESVRIGVLANRGIEVAARQWNPLGEYLHRAIPELDFQIVPLDFTALYPTVASGELEFVIVNTGQYVELETLHGISRISTLRNLGPNGSGYTRFGGLFFTRAERVDLQSLEDLRHQRLLVVDDTSFGGWLTQWRELKDAGLDPKNDLASLVETGNQEEVVFRVLRGEADAGAVRTDLLERMALDNRIQLHQLRVIAPRSIPGFPFMVSTRLYPEWPMARLRHTSDDLARKVVMALLAMTPEDAAARSARIAGWTIPDDYTPVHELYRELHLGPYRDLGRIDPIEVLRRYWPYLAGVLLILFILAVSTFLVSRSNRKLREVQLALQGKQEELGKTLEDLSTEKEVVEATLGSLQATLLRLDETNQQMAGSIDYARSIQESLLPGTAVLKKLMTEVEVWWDPLEVVGGDYYWLGWRGETAILFLADCTGHGVPGAFMTMLVASALDRALQDNDSPAAILTTLDGLVRERLRQARRGVLEDDGLEAGLCLYRPSCRELVYCGAGVPLFIQEGERIREILPNRASLGYRTHPLRGVLQEHVLSVAPNSCYFLFTDGMTDQLGGQPKRLLGRRGLSSLLLGTQNRSLAGRMEEVRQSMAAWRGQEPLRDDRTMIGFVPC
ncbi:MAG: PhnD/SsuA/transferrin family substrate-binding protein [Magnetococcales bacterium]|nr:PhnD/SsuA/transferrin family substrate-binding protein [Magnetococcales bacterium]